MKRWFNIALLAFLAPVLMAPSCGGSAGENRQADYAVAPVEGGVLYDVEPKTVSQDIPDAAAERTDKKMIKSGDMSIDVTDLAAVKTAVEAELVLYGGYCSSERYFEYEEDRTKNYTLNLRIPSQRFDEFVSALESSDYGTVTEKNIGVEDVSVQFVDLEMRLASKRGYLERYRELLKKAATVKDVLEIEEQIRVIEEEIESAEARLRYLSDQVSYSSLQLTLSREEEYKFTPQTGSNFWEQTKRALWGSWDVLKYFALGLIYIWPLALIAVGAVFLVQYLRRRRKAKRATQVE